MLRYMTAGESHGKALVAVLDGVPAGLEFSSKDINSDLKRRMKGYGRGARMSIESDKAEVIAGLRKGKTIGSPIAILIANRDFKIDKLGSVKDPRPGHADLAGMMKYGTHDAREVLERASARETAARVAVGAVAKKLLSEFGIDIISHVVMIGSVFARTATFSFTKIKNNLGKASRVRCADKEAEKLMCRVIDEARRRGDTLGGSFEVIAKGVPAGLGSYSEWDRRLDGALARAIMSIPAVKAVSIGAGIGSSGAFGSEVHDEILYSKTKKAFVRETNNAGGLEGGVTNGELVTVKGFMKPIATLKSALKTVNINTKRVSRAATERADVCAVSACGVVAEAAVAVELASSLLEKFGGDSLSQTKKNYKAYKLDVKKL